MPVKKTTRRAPARKPRKKATPMIEESIIDPIDPMDTDIGMVHQSAPPPPRRPHGMGRCCLTSSEWGHRLLATLGGILLVYLIVFLGVLIRNEIQEYNYIGYADRMERMITIEGEGSVEVKPDVGHIRMGLLTEADTVEEAQAENAETMNTLIARLKEMGIVDEDIKTENYNVYPMYDWTEDDGRVLSGYSVNQSLRVRIQDLDMTEKIIGLAGSLEINDVGELEYSIDDRDVYVEEARVEALEKVSQKAQALTRALGVDIVGIVSYDEYEMDNGYFGDFGMAKAFDEGGFGGAPQIETGVDEVKLNVNVTFEIR